MLFAFVQGAVFGSIFFLRKMKGAVVVNVVAVLNDPKATINARLRATELIFNYTSRYAESRDILARMERLEECFNAE